MLEGRVTTQKKADKCVIHSVYDNPQEKISQKKILPLILQTIMFSVLSGDLPYHGPSTI